MAALATPPSSADEPAGLVLPGQVPTDVREKVRRATEQIDEHRAEVDECMAFWRGQHYVHINGEKRLTRLDTASHADGTGKPPHRVRNAWNLIHGVIEGKVSAATQRVPGYDVASSTTDPEDRGAAGLSSQVALYGYDKWRMRRIARKVVTHALVGREGFAMPYFDPDVAPYHEDPETGDVVGEGEIKIKVFGPSEVGWEQGLDFEDSPWFVTMQAVDPGVLANTYNIDRRTLLADANAGDSSARSSEKPKLVMERIYFERPCRKYPDGRRIVVVNDKVADEGDYPAKNPEGEVVDEPILHRLSYVVDPELDRDRGLVAQLLDPMRTFNDAHSKISEWKNRALNPQMKAPVGSMRGRRTDEPGVVNYYQPVGGKEPEWEQVPQIPAELFRLLDISREVLYEIAAAGDPPDNVESARARSLDIEQSRQRWQAFIGDLAEWHSRVMRHCLSLVAQHYSEPRMLRVKGRFGPELIRDFRGADLRSQIDVTVLPGSIEPRTRQSVMQQVQFIAATFPGYLTPEIALSAINGGNAEALIEGYERDVGRIHSIIQKLKEGPDAFLNEPGADPQRAPSWMPRPQDNIAVWKAILGDWMKTSDYEMADAPTKEAADLVWDGIEYIEAQQAARQAAMQQQMAEQMGAANAAKAPSKGMPSLPGVAGSAGQMTGPSGPPESPVA